MVVFWLVLVGLAMGSFVDALVWRVYQQSLPKKKRAATDKELSIISGRSMCPHCKHTLAWYDLLPIISWSMLRAKCRYCKTTMHWQYPLLEAGMAGLFVLSYAFWPVELVGATEIIPFAAWLLSLVGLVALAVYDLRWMLLPNRIVLPVGVIAAVGALSRIITSTNSVNTAVLVAGSVAVAGGIFYVLFQLSDGRWIGGGDVKLGFVLGLLLATPALAFLMLFVASLLGLLAAMPGVVAKRRHMNSKLPFGPFLIAATVLVQLFGQELIDWYAGLFLYM